MRITPLSRQRSHRGYDMHDTKTAYLISLIELQLNRKGYYIQREVRSGSHWIDAVAELSPSSSKKSSTLNRFAIEYKAIESGSIPRKKSAPKHDQVPWLGETIRVFWITLYPDSREVEVPAELSKMIKSEQSMVVRKLT